MTVSVFPCLGQKQASSHFLIFTKLIGKIVSNRTFICNSLLLNEIENFFVYRHFYVLCCELFIAFDDLTIELSSSYLLIVRYYITTLVIYHVLSFCFFQIVDLSIPCNFVLIKVVILQILSMAFVFCAMHKRILSFQ